MRPSQPDHLEVARLRERSQFNLHTQRQRALILEAQRKQEQAKARLLSLEVVKHAALLALTVALVVIAIVRLLAGPDLVSLGLGLGRLIVGLG